MYWNNNNSIWSWKIETSQYGNNERKWNKWNNNEKIGYKLDQASKIITHAHHDVLLPFFNCNINKNQGHPN
jgi:hypothetical protein